MILLDEVEKAHPEVFDVLLQVLDDGRLTDGQGRTVDFRNVILILTSNLGSQFIIDPNLPWEERKQAVQRPRAPGVQAGVREPARRHRGVLAARRPTTSARSSSCTSTGCGRRLAERRLELAVTPDARAWLAERGYDPIYGARPLRRLMQHEIDDQLARSLLAGEIRDGDTVLVGVGDDGLTVSRLDAEMPPASGGQDDVIEAELLDE